MSKRQSDQPNRKTRRREGEQHLKIRKETVRIWLVQQAIKIRNVEAALKSATTGLFNLLDQRAIA
jgi:hypothetical protein